MDNLFKPALIDREIRVNSSAVLMCKINKDGIVEYINHSFSEISGYEEFEIIGESIDLLYHPDMPKAIIKKLKERLENQQPMRVIIKLLAKDGRFFWLISDYQSKTNETNGMLAHYIHAVSAHTFAVHKIESLYKILLNIELKSNNADTSKRYLLGFLEERNVTYDQFIEELSVNRPEFEENYSPKDFGTSKSPQIPLRNISEPTFQPIASSITESAPTNHNKQKKQKSLLKRVFGK